MSGPLAPTRPSLARVWLSAVRPATLWVSVVPVAVGTALVAATGTVAPLAALAALLGALAIQVGTNLVNDHADFVKGADRDDRLGPPRAAAQGWLQPRTILLAAGLSFLVAALLGAYLVSLGGWPIAILGVTGILSGIAYTAGPLPLAYVGLGDAFVLAFFGVGAVAGTTWVQGAELWTRPVLTAALPIGLLATGILVVNNLRDRESDARANKRTLVVRFGRRFGLIEYAACVLLPFVLPALAVAFGWVGPGWLLVFLCLPLALIQVARVRSAEGAALNPHLGATARLQLVYGALLCGGALL